MKEKELYYIYILRCENSSLYTGITKNIERRFEEHKKGKGAKYTRAKKVEKLELYFNCYGRSDASKIECFIKKLKKEQKEEILLNFEGFKEVIEKKLNIKIKK